MRFHQPPQQTIFGITLARFQDIDGNSFELIGTDHFTREIEQERQVAAAKIEADRRTAQELEIARQVQARLFPQTLPPLKTLDYAVLGLFEEWDSPIEECQLSPGDTLALYTDGVTESFDASGEEFGEQRLVEALQQNKAMPAKHTLASVVEQIQSFSPHEQHDDITLIVAKCTSNQNRKMKTVQPPSS